MGELAYGDSAFGDDDERLLNDTDGSAFPDTGADVAPTEGRALRITFNSTGLKLLPVEEEGDSDAS